MSHNPQSDFGLHQERGALRPVLLVSGQMWRRV